MSNIYPVTAEFTELENGTLIKYANGYAEFISKDVKLDNLTSTPIGNLHRCDIDVDLDFGGITFKAVPNVNANIVTNIYIISRLALSKNNIMKVCLYSHAAFEGAYTKIMYRAFGRWK